MIQLKIKNRNTNEENTLSFEKDTLTLGRQDTCDVVLSSKGISRNHAEISKLEGSYFITDTDSGNGTLLNGNTIKPREKNLLKASDVIRIAEFEIQPIFEEAFEEENTDAGVLEIRMIKKVLSALDSETLPSIEILDDPLKGKKIPLTQDKDEWVIGRDTDCPIVIPSAVVSRKHASIQKKWGGIVIQDLGSKNGTFVNSEKISEKQLKDGDLIVLGTVQILFRNPEDVDVESITKEYKKKELGLEPKPEEKPATPPSEKISEEAKISVEPEPKKEEAPKEKPQEEKKETQSGEPKKEEPKKEDPKKEDKKKQEPKKEEPKKPEKPQKKSPEKPVKKGFSGLEIIFLILALLVLGGAGTAIWWILFK